MSLTNQLNYFTASEPAATDTVQVPPVVPSSSAWVNTLALNWSHQYTEAFSSALSAGVTQTLTPNAGTFMQVQPTGTAALSYNFLLATAALSYAHMAQPNLTTGTVNFSDAVSLRLSVPIGLTGLSAIGTAGYTHSVPVGTPTIVCPAGTTCSSPATSPARRTCSSPTPGSTTARSASPRSPWGSAGSSRGRC